MLLFLHRYLQADEHEETEDITQHDIADVVDITSAQKVRGNIFQLVTFLTLCMLGKF